MTDAATLLASGVITAGSGSAGGDTLSHNRGGLYLRERVTPTDPASAFQIGRRNQMTFVSGRWQTISQARRDAWACYARTYQRRSPLARSRRLSPRNAFIAVNFPRFMAALTMVLDPPGFHRADALSPVVIVPKTTATRITVHFDESDPWVTELGAGLLVFCSQGQSPTINWFRGPYRLCGTIRGNRRVPPTSPFALGSGFGFLQVGDHWFGRCYTSRLNGDRSPVQFIGPVTVAS